jgi:PilZ domain
MFNKKDQRNIPRKAVNCQINYKNVNATHFKHGTVLNISSKGVLFIADELVEAGTMMEIMILPGTAAIPSHGAIIEVVRVNPTDTSNLFEIAGLIKVIK